MKTIITTNTNNPLSTIWYSSTYTSAFPWKKEEHEKKLQEAISNMNIDEKYILILKALEEIEDDEIENVNLILGWVERFVINLKQFWPIKEKYKEIAKKVSEKVWFEIFAWSFGGVNWFNYQKTWNSFYEF